MLQFAIVSSHIFGKKIRLAENVLNCKKKERTAFMFEHCSIAEKHNAVKSKILPWQAVLKLS